MTAAEDDPIAAELVLQPLAEEVRTARAFAVKHATPYATDDEAGDDFLMAAATVTSELTTNAIQAGARLIRLQLRTTDDSIDISVIDDASGSVEITEQDPLALSGRGLRMIARLAREWGVSPHPEGKRVWAELQFPR